MGKNGSERDQLLHGLTVDMDKSSWKLFPNTPYKRVTGVTASQETVFDLVRTGAEVFLPTGVRITLGVDPSELQLVPSIRMDESPLRKKLR